MSQQLINRNADLQRLRNEGFDIQVKNNYLLMRGVPYVNSRKEVARGTLVSELSLAGDLTIRPATHVIYFAGDYPCKADGSEITKIRHQSLVKQLDRDLSVHHSFSSKPEAGYKDHYEKMTTYARQSTLTPRRRPFWSSKQKLRNRSSTTSIRLRAGRRSPRSPESWSWKSSGLWVLEGPDLTCWTL
jgi:hypothetical protein